MSKVMDTVRRYSWLLIVVAFIIIISKWVLVMRYASENRPEMIDIHKPKPLEQSHDGN